MSLIKFMLQKYIRWLCVLPLVLCAALALAEASDSETPAEKMSDAKVANADRIIELETPSEDAKIRRRLESILASSEQFTELSIRVDNGLVFLRGYSSDADFMAWASDIAKNIDGVVAVVNNLELAPIDYFSSRVLKEQFSDLWISFLRALPLLAAAALTFLFFFFTARPVAAFLVRPVSFMTDSSLIQVVLRRLLSIFIILMGFYFFLRIAGLTQFAVAVISGTGLMGLVLGFAFRDIAENFIASLLLSVQRPFRLEDVIEVSGFRGVVQKVTTRGTTLVDFDGNHIQIPNAIIYKNVIQNFSANPNVRGSFAIGVGYDAKVRFAQEAAMALILEHPAILADPEPQVLIDSLGSSTINLKVYFWVNAAEYSVVKVASSLMRQVVRAFEAADVSMPDDAREVIFPQGVPWVDDSKTAEPATIAPERSQSEPELEAITVEHSGMTNRLLNDLASDTSDIQQQAKRSRDPEAGANII